VFTLQAEDVLFNKGHIHEAYVFSRKKYQKSWEKTSHVKLIYKTCTELIILTV